MAGGNSGVNRNAPVTGVANPYELGHDFSGENTENQSLESLAEAMAATNNKSVASVSETLSPLQQLDALKNIPAQAAREVNLGGLVYDSSAARPVEKAPQAPAEKNTLFDDLVAPVDETSAQDRLGQYEVQANAEIARIQEEFVKLSRKNGTQNAGRNVAEMTVVNPVSQPDFSLRTFFSRLKRDEENTALSIMKRRQQGRQNLAHTKQGPVDFLGVTKPKARVTNDVEVGTSVNQAA